MLLVLKIQPSSSFKGMDQAYRLGENVVEWDGDFLTNTILVMGSLHMEISLARPHLSDWVLGGYQIEKEILCMHIL
jgi:hypothetical protein